MNTQNIEQSEAALYVSKQIELLNTTDWYNQPSGIMLKEEDASSEVESTKVLASEQQSESTMSTVAATVLQSEAPTIGTLELSDLGSTFLSSA